MGEEVTRKRNCNRLNRFATVSDTRRKGEVSRECHHILHSTSSSCQIRAVSPHANHSCAASRQSQLLYSTNFSVPPNRTVPLHTSHSFSTPCQWALCYITRIIAVPPQVNLICLPHANGAVPPPSQSEMFLLYPIRTLPTLANQRCFSFTQSELFQLFPIRAVPPHTNMTNLTCSTSSQLELFHLVANQVCSPPPRTTRAVLFFYISGMFHSIYSYDSSLPLPQSELFHPYQRCSIPIQIEQFRLSSIIPVPPTLFVPVQIYANQYTICHWVLFHTTP